MADGTRVQLHVTPAGPQANARGRGDLFPGTARTRGYNALKATLGYRYGLDVKYFVGQFPPGLITT